MSNQVSTNYQNFNTQQSKNPVLVVTIAGINDIFSSAPVYTIVKYGDPGITYGEAGLVYGGLRPYSVLLNGGAVSNFRDIISLDGSSFQISQTLEPEQGRASISQLSIAFLDVDGYMSQVVSPGVLIPEILGAQVEVFLGFSQISYPDDFLTIFKGVVTSVTAGPGLITLGLSDPSVKRRTQLFYCQQTSVSSAVMAGDTTINVVSNVGFFAQIVAPDGSIWPFAGNPVCFTYIKIDDEWIECQPNSMNTTQFIVVNRGARGTTAASHAIGAAVNAGLQIGA